MIQINNINIKEEKQNRVYRVVIKEGKQVNLIIVTICNNFTKCIQENTIITMIIIFKEIFLKKINKLYRVKETIVTNLFIRKTKEKLNKVIKSKIIKVRKIDRVDKNMRNRYSKVFKVDKDRKEIQFKVSKVIIVSKVKKKVRKKRTNTNKHPKHLGIYNNSNQFRIYHK